MKPASRPRVSALLAALFLTGAAPQPEKPDPFRISGPYTHDNLSIFLIHGEDQLRGRKLLTLKEALSKKKVVVHETGDVNELSIENRSDDEVFVQAGDIVKGGQQDRVLSLDVILPPKSGKIPVSAFCVEQGRWSERRGEAKERFSSSDKALSSKKLKLAARKAENQGEVWKEVAATQAKLGEKVKGNVKSARSETSLQLTLEDGAVSKTAGEYVSKLSPILDGKDDVVGFAFAINGKVNSAEVYASPALMKTSWPKLLESSAVEAVAEREDRAPGAKAAAAPAATDSDVKKLLSVRPDRAKRTEKKVTRSINLTTLEDPEGNVLFETRDDARGAWIHRSYY